MLTDRQRLALARARVELARSLDGKVQGLMEIRNWTDADVERMLTSDKVLRGVARDLDRNP